MLWLRDAPPVFFWVPLALMLFHLFLSPVLLAAGVLRPGFRRVY
jgi:hypothetical protein